jgi:2-amino-4-hydroxy-6-hydroxymethyldihydropteridine diphosphokinase
LSDPNNNPIHEVYIGFGSNIDPANNFKLAVKQLRNSVQIKAITKVWETPPVGTSGPNFLNAAALIHTPLELDALRENVLRQIESKMGRIRTDDPNASRPIDLDILLFDEKVIENEIWTQAHIALPLAELLPNFLCVETGETLQEIAYLLEKTNHLNIRSDVNLDISQSE